MKTAFKEIKEDMWKFTLHSWFGRTNIIKMAIKPKLSYRDNEVPLNTHNVFHEIDQTLLKFMWK